MSGRCDVEWDPNPIHWLGARERGTTCSPTKNFLDRRRSLCPSILQQLCPRRVLAGHADTLDRCTNGVYERRRDG